MAIVAVCTSHESALKLMRRKCRASLERADELGLTVTQNWSLKDPYVLVGYAEGETEYRIQAIETDELLDEHNIID